MGTEPPRGTGLLMFGKSLFLCLALMGAGGAMAAQGPTLEQRVLRLERILQNQSLSDLVLQLQRLQKEVRLLRGELEEQKHALEAQNRRQRDLYVDLDRRISEARTAPPAGEIAGGVPPAPAAAPRPTPVSPMPSRALTEGPAATSVDPAVEKAAYEQAFELLRQGSYVESIGAFRSFLANYPGGAYADNAQYWLGEASYVTRDFESAMEDFKQVLARFPDSNKVPGAMLKIGYIHYERRAWNEARAMLSKLSGQFPGTTEARLARQRLDRMRNENH